MAQSKDVVIIGGGPVGAACARELAGTGRTVLVLDANGRPGEAWRASAGLLAPQIDPREDSPLLELAIAGREFYREAAGPLLEETGVDIELYDGGILQLARGGEQEDKLKASVAWQRQHGHRAEWLDPAEVKNEFSWAGPNDGALWAPHDGLVNPIRLVEALRLAATHRGVEFAADTAVGLAVESGRATGVRTGRGFYPAGNVVLAAGAWSGRLENLPRPVSVEPVRGQMVAMPWPAKVPTCVVYSNGSYVLRRGEEAHCGATAEHAGFSAEPSAAGERWVVDSAAALMPALASAVVASRWAGFRPGTPDGLPIVGAEPSVPNLWYATGHGRDGILLAGITAVALTHLFNGEATFDGVAAYRPDRFWDW